MAKNTPNTQSIKESCKSDIFKSDDNTWMYWDYKYNYDIEIYNVIMPSSNPLYSRDNPICTNPQIDVRNNGRKDVTAITFNYYVSGGML